FAFETDTGGWAPMTHSWFLNCCNEIWKRADLFELSGHCFRIGGAMELLLRGTPESLCVLVIPTTPPDIVAMQGRWKSRAFLEYWR
ncbi:hypothetical protein F4604DRAFT_1505732, partial [Suillus subluteus]